MSEDFKIGLDYYIRKTWSMLKDSIYAAQYALQNGIEYSEELLVRFKNEENIILKSNKNKTEALERDIEQMKKRFGRNQTP